MLEKVNNAEGNLRNGFYQTQLANDKAKYTELGGIRTANDTELARVAQQRIKIANDTILIWVAQPKIG